ncbi:alpha/beta hydrolase [Neorhizobium sp. JUb45]|uniref:alpha/beta hydrolase n=1 Tax=unclassified Neorhizobium TaxID=2629175 RepID=UPI001404FEF0|nr:alpha/beta hydrolase [Neorhizobium sp. JUb45]
MVPAHSIKNVVLVHGAFVDASIWSDVIRQLQAAGYTPSAVQLPMTSLKADIDATQQVIDRTAAPILLVGYSYGGMPVTEVGSDPKVRGLVYVAAMAPRPGQSINDLFDRGAPGLPGQAAVEQSSDGFFWLTPSLFRMALAHDAPEDRTATMSVSQRPIAISTFGQAVSKAAWMEKPSWYAISADDKIIPVALERKMAKDIKAVTIELNTAHASPLSQPKAVAAFISQAANAIAD